jgi:hypothetical protein
MGPIEHGSTAPSATPAPVLVACRITPRVTSGVIVRGQRARVIAVVRHATLRAGGAR